MQRRNFPARRSDSILLYGLGLALAFSLLFNGFLLYEQSRQQSIYEYELGNSVNQVDVVVWQQQLSECRRASQQKDSLIHQLAKLPTAPLGKTVAIHPARSKQ